MRAKAEEASPVRGIVIVIVTGSIAETVKDHEIGTIEVIEMTEEEWTEGGMMIIVMEGMEGGGLGIMAVNAKQAGHVHLLGMATVGDLRVLFAGVALQSYWGLNFFFYCPTVLRLYCLLSTILLEVKGIEEAGDQPRKVVLLTHCACLCEVEQLDLVFKKSPNSLTPTYGGSAPPRRHSGAELRWSAEWLTSDYWPTADLPCCGAG
uniref:Uncharacterized protein n=1 Tax=Chenopodium quinoa TaxID=63459 RepID=A0A803LMI7_CHEQI